MPLTDLGETTVAEFQAQQFYSGSPKHIGRLGWDMSMDTSGEILVATQLQHTNSVDTVYAEIYSRSGNTWGLLTTITKAAIVGSTSYYGWSSSISGDDGTYIAISAPATSTNDGAVYIYYSSDLLTWGSVATILPATSNKFFGSDVKLSDDGSSCYITDYEGSVYISTRSSTNTWTSSLSVTITGPSFSASLTNFSNPISISGDATYSIVGHPLVDSNQGQVKLYTSNSLIQTINGPTGTTEYFGYSVSMSNDGSYVAIGQPTKTKDHYDFSGTGGKVHIYFRGGGSAYALQSTLDSSDLSVNSAMFGQALCLTELGNFLMVTDPGYLNMAGTSWIFSRSGSTWTNTEQVGSDFEIEFKKDVTSDNVNLVIGVAEATGVASTIAIANDYTPTTLATALDTTCNGDGISVALESTYGAQTGVVEFTKDDDGTLAAYTFTVDVAPTVSETITITLNGFTNTVALLSSDSASGAAAKIADSPVSAWSGIGTGWTAVDAGAIVTFTAVKKELKPDVFNLTVSTGDLAISVVNTIVGVPVSSIQFYVENQSSNFGTELGWSEDVDILTSNVITAGTTPVLATLNQDQWILTQEDSSISDAVHVLGSNTIPIFDQGSATVTYVSPTSVNVSTPSTIVTGGTAKLTFNRCYGVISKSLIGSSCVMDTTGIYSFVSAIGLKSRSSFADEGSIIAFTNEQSSNDYTNGITVDKTATNALRVQQNNAVKVLFNVDTSNMSVTIGDDGTSVPGSSLSCLDTDKGVLINRLTTTQKLAIISPPKGLLVYDTVLDRLEFYSSGW
ncbi:MAG: hypothetical protein N2B06_12405, partial [Clostridium sp.]